jgi:hypothetical protein
MDLTPEGARRLAGEMRARAAEAELAAEQAPTGRAAFALLTKAREGFTGAARWEALAARMEAIEAAGRETQDGADGDLRRNPHGRHRFLRLVG